MKEEIKVRETKNLFDVVCELELEEEWHFDAYKANYCIINTFKSTQCKTHESLLMRERPMARKGRT